MILRSLLLSAFLLAAASAEEATPLFNGKDLSCWTNGDGQPVTAGWVVEPGGILHRAAKGGDLFTAQEYRDFELSWEWKISPGGNSGLKYRVQAYPEKGFLGCEYQILDDLNHPDGKIGPHRQTAALYDILPPAPDKPLLPVGQWNRSKVVVKGQTFAHWLNGRMVLAVDLTSAAFKAGRAQSKFKSVVGFAENPSGRIMIQDHQDEAWFRHITLKPL